MSNTTIVRVAVGCDHAGFELKGYLLGELAQRGIQTIDLGTDSSVDTDYPPFCFAVGQAVASGQADWGIVLGGSGQGEMIAANKVPGIRAALCNDPYLARLARLHNNANILSIGARIVALPLAAEILDAWIKTSFEGGRHQRRIDLILDYERQRNSDLSSDHNS